MARSGYHKIPQDDKDEIEMSTYGRAGAEGYHKNEKLEFRKRKRSPVNLPITSWFSPTRLVAGVVVILVVLIVAVMIALAVLSAGGESSVPPTNPPGSTSPTKDPSHLDWVMKLQPAYNEMSILIHDTNGDGTPDILTTFLTDYFDNPNYISCPGKTSRCMEEHGFDPCTIRIVAVDGINGSIIWTLWVEFSAFAINCREDLNTDGIHDCLFAGRGGALVAVDVHAGAVLWVVDESATFPRYNYLYPALSRDFDHDGAPDILVTHGGDQFYDDSEKNRSPGFMFVISGGTGQRISPMYPMPDDHETYSSAILYTNQEVDLVLYGSGGETISGSLWAVTLDSLQESVDSFLSTLKPSYVVSKKYVSSQCYTQSEINERRPRHTLGDFMREKHESWMDNCPSVLGDVPKLWNKYRLCAYEVVGSARNGQMVPPVKVDVTKDGVLDLVVSQFNDHTLLIDGASGEHLWNHYVQDTQTYSIPAPIYYNDDDIPDILMRLNKGKWMTYDYSYLVVLDGKDGKTSLMPTLNCSGGVMSSPVTAQSKVKGQDGMFFVGVGCKESHHDNKRRAERDVRDSCPRRFIEGEETCPEMGGANRDKRHGGMHPTGETDHDGSGDDDDMVSPVVDYISPDELTQDYLDSIWIPKNKSDAFPDPWIDTEGRYAFIEDYCGLSVNSLTAYLYFLTPSLIESGGIRPLMAFEPYVYKEPKHERSRRHHPGGLVKEMLDDMKMVRCSHILTPYMVASSPGLYDLNGDGLLEGMATVLYFSTPNELAMVLSLHPSTVHLHAFTLEEKVREVYGAHAASMDFRQYHPMEHQSWTQYMGTEGDNTFRGHTR